MAIKLRVISDQYRELGEHRSRVFGVNGGSIGRAPDNDWVLPDQKRTRLRSPLRHRVPQRRLLGPGPQHQRRIRERVRGSRGRTGPVALQDGDRLRLGDYEILVSVDDRIDFLPAASELHSAEKHLDQDIGAQLDLDSLLTPRDTRRVGFRSPCATRSGSSCRRSSARPRRPPAQPESESGRTTNRRPRPSAGTAAAEDAAHWRRPRPPNGHSRRMPSPAKELADALARRQEPHRARAADLALPPAGAAPGPTSGRRCRHSAAVLASTRHPSRPRRSPCCR